MWESYRTKHNSDCGAAYAAMYPEQLLPKELERFMGRPRGSTNKPKEGEAAPAAKTSKVVNALSEALAFISVAATKKLQPYNEFCEFTNGFVVMSDGQISAGYPVEEQLNSIPNFNLLQKAIKGCGKSISITELDEGRLSIVGEKLRVIVPCLPHDDFPEINKDAPIAVIDDRLKHAFVTCGAVADENGERLVECSLLLEANQCTATDGLVLIQYWHGIDLPPNLVIPKIFAKAVTKVKQPITAFGWTPEHSITFYFEGGAWIKTLLYQDKWPDISAIINVQSIPQNVLPGFFEGCLTVGEFNDDARVYISEEKVSSHRSLDIGAQYEVKSLTKECSKVFSYESIKIIAPHVKTIDLVSYADRAFFFGDNLRGVIISYAAGVE